MCDVLLTYGDKCVTVALDMTPIRNRSGARRLLKMISGRSKLVSNTWPLLSPMLA